MSDPNKQKYYEIIVHNYNNNDFILDLLPSAVNKLEKNQLSSYNDTSNNVFSIENV